MSRLVSVIIPVYNVEKYLNKCIDSVLRQTYKNIEIILVDDGSNDRSGVICDEYMKKDTRVKIIHKENGGLSSARNCGLKIATGELVTFIDSDDVIEIDFIECLENKIKKDIDIAFCEIKVIHNSEINYESDKGKFRILNNVDLLKMMLHDQNYVSACGKIYKKELFNDLEFPYGKIHEDIATIYKAILKANKIAYLPNEKYFYLKREGSITNEKFNIKRLDLIEATDKMCDDIAKYSPLLKIDCINCKAHARIAIIRLIMESDEKIYQQILDNCKIFLKRQKKIILYSKYISFSVKCATVCLLIDDRLFKILWKYYSKYFREV